MSEKEFQQGSISIHAQNIMPVIKRWLYSDKDIFIREMVSNGCDALTKLNALYAIGEAEKPDNQRLRRHHQIPHGDRRRRGRP